MGITVIEEMNYRYNNPTITLTPDEKIVAIFLEQEREKNVREQFILWASMSKENKDNKLIDMIEAKEKEQKITK